MTEPKSLKELLQEIIEHTDAHNDRSEWRPEVAKLAQQALDAAGEFELLRSRNEYLEAQFQYFAEQEQAWRHQVNLAHHERDENRRLFNRATVDICQAQELAGVEDERITETVARLVDHRYKLSSALEMALDDLKAWKATEDCQESQEVIAKCEGVIAEIRADASQQEGLRHCQYCKQWVPLKCADPSGNIDSGFCEPAPTGLVIHDSKGRAYNEEQIAAIQEHIEKASPAAAPEGYALLPTRLTAENGAKYLLSGEFFENFETDCDQCSNGIGVEYDDGDTEPCEFCNGTTLVTNKVTITWTNIKEIWTKAADALALKPEEPTQ